MPIVTVHAPLPSDPARVQRCLGAIETQLAAALRQAPDSVRAEWVPTVRPGAGATERGPLVIIRARAGRHGGVVQQGLKAVAEATAEALSCPVTEVVVHWQEQRPGRVFAGGGVR